MYSEQPSFASKLRSSAPGGLVIGGFLLLWASLPLRGAAKASEALEAFQKNVASPEPLVLVPVIVAMLACMAFSGNGPIDFFSRWLLRPALRFCADFCVAAAGAILPFGLPWLRTDPRQAAAYMALAFVVVAGAGWTFHRGVELSEEMSSDTLPQRTTRVLNWLGFAGLAAWGALEFLGT